jgi:hypothetical protein
MASERYGPELRTLGRPPSPHYAVREALRWADVPTARRMYRTETSRVPSVQVSMGAIKEPDERRRYLGAIRDPDRQKLVRPPSRSRRRSQRI